MYKRLSLILIILTITILAIWGIVEFSNNDELGRGRRVKRDLPDRIEYKSINKTGQRYIDRKAEIKTEFKNLAEGTAGTRTMEEWEAFFKEWSDNVNYEAERCGITIPWNQLEGSKKYERLNNFLDTDCDGRERLTIEKLNNFVID